jgi:tRNA-dihydrouridine synthase B
VMIGRAGLARPWLFRQAQAAIRGEPVPTAPTPEEQCNLIREQFRLVVEQHGADKACILMRSMATPYTRGQPGAKNFRIHLAKISKPEEFYNLIECDYPR